MIQRKQTLFMLATAVLCSLLFFFPLATITATAPADAVAVGTVVDGGQYTIWGIDYANGMNLPIVYHGVLAIIATALPLITIFLYKRRRLQLSLCFFEGILVVGLLVFEGVGMYKLNAALAMAPHYIIDHSLVLVAPLFAVATTFMAYKGVLRDILLLSSTDRIR